MFSRAFARLPAAQWRLTQTVARRFVSTTEGHDEGDQQIKSKAVFARADNL